MSNKVKIMIVGPCKSGKTLLANFLSRASETVDDDYKPTKLSRILWFEVNGVPLDESQFADITVELWDLSGDKKFKVCWPTMQHNANGIIFVYNPGVDEHLKELENWYVNFARKDLGLSDENCMIFSVQRRRLTGALKKPTIMRNVKLVKAYLEDDPNTVETYFKQFLSNLVVHSTCATSDRLNNPLLT